MLKKTTLLLLSLILVLGGLGAGAAAAYTPANGARFNDPGGDREAVNRSMVHIRRSIQSAKKGSIIRIATYSHSRRDITEALIDACKNRKVTVQMVINDNFISKTTQRLRRVLGGNTKPHFKDACHPRKKKKGEEKYAEPSYLKVCFQSCRKGAGNQHMKFYLFSDVGDARDVVMVGSTNIARFAAKTHFNDLFTQANRSRMFRDYSAIHRQLAQDRRVKKVARTFQHGDLTSEFGAVVARGPKDPVIKRLKRISCAGGTQVRITMYAWVGDRGAYIARQVAKLRRQGCNIRAILSGPSKDVKRILKGAGVSIRSADIDRDDNTATGFGETAWERFTHEKWMSVNGGYAGKRQKIVFTGSENWSGLSFLNDEVTVTIPRESVWAQYNSHFDFVWNFRTRAYG
ncbi:MAG: phospholipase D-like domain-containing protein [Nocardioides sp.]